MYVHVIHVIMYTCSLHFELVKTKSAYTCGGTLKLMRTYYVERRQKWYWTCTYVVHNTKPATLYVGIVSVKLHEHYINNY